MFPLPLKEGEVVQSFLFETPNIILSRVTTQRSCPSCQCDSQHAERQCPGNIGSRMTQLSKSASLSVLENGIYRVRFTSESLASVFLSEQALCAAKLSVREVRLSVRRVLDHCADKQKTFIVAGWFKRAYSQDVTPAPDVNLHVTLVTPKTERSGIGPWRCTGAAPVQI